MNIMVVITVVVVNNTNNTTSIKAKLYGNLSLINLRSFISTNRPIQEFEYLYRECHDKLNNNIFSTVNNNNTDNNTNNRDNILNSNTNTTNSPIRIEFSSDFLVDFRFILGNNLYSFIDVCLFPLVDNEGNSNHEKNKYSS